MIRSVILRPRLTTSKLASSKATFLAFSSKSNVSAAKGSPNPLTFAFSSSDQDDDDDNRPKNPKKPNFVGLPKQWDKLDMATQEEIIEYLEDGMRGDWKNLTNDEKKSCKLSNLANRYREILTIVWFIYYGPWGPRSTIADDPGKVYRNFAIFISVMMVGVTGYKIYDNSKKETNLE